MRSRGLWLPSLLLILATLLTAATRADEYYISSSMGDNLNANIIVPNNEFHQLSFDFRAPIISFFVT